MAENLEESFDIELFIGEIKNHPEIWNISAETYHDRQKKRGAWIKICRIFYEGFDEKDEKERNEICKYYLIPPFFFEVATCKFMLLRFSDKYKRKLVIITIPLVSSLVG